MELSKSTDFYKKNWQIKIADDNGYTSKYSHTPIEMIKFAEKYYQHRLSVPNVSDNHSVIDGIIESQDPATIAQKPLQDYGNKESRDGDSM